MSFYRQLQDDTAEARRDLFDAPVIRRALDGGICLTDYLSFLTQAYHHVRHTVPLLMATGAALPPEREWLREAVAEYIAEETGHQEWILDDIAACGFDREAAGRTTPSPATELMVAYAWDMVNRVNPLGFFGMVFVLEGTSTAIASRAAERIREQLALPEGAFSYLSSHGSLDLEHMAFFESLMNRIEDAGEQRLILHAAGMFYRLYGDIFRTLPVPAFLETAA